MFVVFVMISVVLVSQRGGSSSTLQWLIAGVSSTVCLVLVLASRIMPQTLPGSPWLRRLPRPLFAFLEEHWPRLHDGFEAVRRPKLLLALLLLNVAGWTVDIAIYWVYGQAFNLDVPLGAYVSVAVVTALITTFPITFGNVGSWEFGFLGALALYNVPADVALAYAVGTHVFISLYSIGLGLLAMALLGVKPAEVLRMRGPSPAHGEAQAAPAP